MDAASMTFLQSGNLVKVEEAPASMERLHRRSCLSTFVLSIEECRKTRDLALAKRLHMDIKDSGLEAHRVVANPLVQLYAQCGSLSAAQEAFDRLLEAEEPSWTSLIVGYVKAEQLSDVVFPTAFIDMYCNCGSMTLAQQVFDIIKTKDRILWTALLTGYAQQGNSNLVFQVYDNMRLSGLQPNSITFLSLLNVCSHSGLCNTATEILEVMRNKYGIEPDIKHLNCAVDLLGRSGQFVEAVAVLEKLPIQPSYVIWSTLLCHCRNHSCAELAKYVFECALSEKELESAFFVIMSNMSGDFLSEDYDEGVP
ncbi:hypothetical protein L7F22_057257 [Adiantum nelumboides]|nr:hypothetical protein [Adiantum nelumboides]